MKAMQNIFMYVKNMNDISILAAFIYNQQPGNNIKVEDNLNGIFQILSITKTYLYNFDPLKPHFYIVKLGFTGVCIIFLISVQNRDCGYSLEPPRRGGSNKYPQSMF